MPLILGALVVAAIIMCGPQAVADAWAMIKAANEGKWDFVQQDRERRSAARQRWFDAWERRRATRSLNAGGDGTWRPGMGAYAKDLYHSFWEDRLEKAQERRVAREANPRDSDQLSWTERFALAVDEIAVAQAKKLGKLLGWGSSDDQAPADDGPPPVPATPTPQPPPTTTPPPTEPQQPRLRALPDLPPDEPPASADGQHGNTNTHEGDSTVTTDVMTNEDVRNRAAVISAAAAKMQEHLAGYEAARAEAAAAQAATADAMSGTAFDGGAVAATADVGDSLDVAAMTHLAEVADSIGAGGKAMHDHLEPYRDAEDLVASSGVSTDTLAATSS